MEAPGDSDLQLKRIKHNLEHQRECRGVVWNSKRVSIGDIEKNLGDVTVHELKQLLQKMRKCTPDISAIKRLRQGLSQGEDMIQVFLSYDGAYPRLVGCLASQDAELQVEAAGCIVNLTTGNHNQCLTVAKASISYLASYLTSSSTILQELCAWAIGNMAADCDQCCALLTLHGCYPLLIATLKSYNPVVVHCSAFALSNYIAHQASNDMTANAELVKVVVPLLATSQVKQLSPDVAQLVFQMTASETWNELLVTHGYLGLVVHHIQHIQQNQHQDVTTLTPLVRCAANLSAFGTQVSELCQTDFSQLTNVICPLLQHKHSHVRKETLLWLSNLVVVGYPGSLELVRHQDLVGNVLQLVDAFTATGNEALTCVTNIAAMGEEPCSILLQCGVVTRLTFILKTPHQTALNNFLIVVLLLLKFCKKLVTTSVHEHDWLPMLENCQHDVSINSAVREGLATLVDICSSKGNT